MRKSFKYRLYPTNKQVTNISSQLEECRLLYNHFLADRIQKYQKHSVSLSLYDQHKTLSTLKKDRSSLSNTHSQVLQNVGVRVDLAFKAFFQRIKKGQKPGFPRYKGFGRYDSFTYPQVTGFSLHERHIRLGKIGNVKINKHRELQGFPKTCTIRRTATGKWFAVISCEVEKNPLPKNENQTGIDVGLKKFATLSNGETIPNPRFFRTEEKELARVQRKLEKTDKQSPRRAGRKRVVARVHERIRNKRHDFTHKTARKIVNRFQVIVVEDLKINQMTKNRHFSKSISDAAWSQFRHVLSCKAEEADRVIITVNPAYTSQDCSNCGYRTRKALSDRMHVCPSCDLQLDRDVNAARNILGLGLQSLGRNA